MAKSKTARSPRIAIIGAGGRATSTHYPVLRQMPGCQLVACCDLDQDRLQKAADAFAIKGRYSDYVEMIDKERPDAVWAIMPPQYLFDICATTIEMGCHLVVEKPPAVTAEQTRQLELLARQHKVLTGVTFQRRFAPVIRQGKKRIERRGPIHTAHASFYKQWSGGPYYRGAMDMLACDGIHAVDTLRYLCGGDVESIVADSRRLAAGHWKVHLALVKFSSGATGVLLVNFGSGRRMFTVEMHTEGAAFFGDPEEGGRLFADNKTQPIEEFDPFALGKSQDPNRAFGAWEVDKHLVDCIRRGRQPETNFADALKTMELVEAVYDWQI